MRMQANVVAMVAVCMLLRGFSATFVNYTTMKTFCQRRVAEKPRETSEECFGNLCHEENANVNFNLKYYLVQGDILCEEDLTNRDQKVIEKGTKEWEPEIKYQIKEGFDDEERQIITETLEDLETKVKKNTVGCKFSLKEESVKNLSQSIAFVKGKGYYTAVGKTATVSSAHLITLGVIKRNIRGSIIHELMHAMGFWHEHVRPDRDYYITVNHTNIKKEKEVYFIKLKNSEVQKDFTAIRYDPCSLLHYGPYAFSKAMKLKTITLKQLTSLKCMGQRRYPAISDIQRIRKMFKCESQTGTGLKSGS